MVMEGRVILIGPVFFVLATVEMLRAMSIDMVSCVREADIACRMHVWCQRETRKNQGDQREERCKRAHVNYAKLRKGEIIFKLIAVECRESLIIP